MTKIKAFAKINWLLDIVGEKDGFHMLDGVMETVDLYDEISICISKGDGVVTQFKNMPPIKDDLCTKGALAFLKAVDQKVKIDIEVEKNIPMGAGLGGGSSDCAAVICYLNGYFGQPLEYEDVHRLCSNLGADVPFFIKGGVQRARGKGEILKAIKPGKVVDIILARPKGEGVSTKEAFKLYDAVPDNIAGDVEAMVLAIEEGDIYGISRCMYNALEAPSIKLKPQIQQVKGALIKAGCIGAIMTGSGSAAFGIVGDEKIDTKELDQFWYRITKTVENPFEIEKQPCN